MKIREVLARVDSLYPNTYTTEEKLNWCYEVSCGIRRNIKRLFGATEQTVTDDGGRVILPPGVTFSEIESVFVNGRKTEKVDERSFTGNGLQAGDHVRVVYLLLPTKYELVDGEVSEELMTECDSPYNTLYLDYVMAQIAFYQQDPESFNQFISQYNQKLAEFSRDYKGRAPLGERKEFYGLWR